MSNQHTDTTRERTAGTVNSVFEQVRTPLLAALGAGNLASQAVSDTVQKAKDRVTEGSETARKNLDELPTDVEQLRERLDPNELRKVIDEYTEAAMKLYNRLAESGEQAWDRLSEQPQVKRALDQLEEALSAVQGRAEDVTAETRERVEDALGKVTQRTRSTGEKAARTVSQAAGDAAEKVQDAGEDLAHETRSATRKAANKTAPKPANGGGRSGSTGSASSTGSSGSRGTGSSSAGSSTAAKKSTGGSTKSTK